jgi:hypothetical protein
MAAVAAAAAAAAVVKPSDVGNGQQAAARLIAHLPNLSWNVWMRFPGFGFRRRSPRSPWFFRARWTVKISKNEKKVFF